MYNTCTVISVCCGNGVELLCVCCENGVLCVYKFVVGVFVWSMIIGVLWLLCVCVYKLIIQKVNYSEMEYSESLQVCKFIGVLLAVE